MENSYSIHDGCFGVIIGLCTKGAFLILDNGEEAFSYDMANLSVGTRVLCTVSRLATENLLMRVKFDSVVRYAPIAA